MASFYCQRISFHMFLLHNISREHISSNFKTANHRWHKLRQSWEGAVRISQDSIANLLATKDSLFPPPCSERTNCTAFQFPFQRIPHLHRPCLSLLFPLLFVSRSHGSITWNSLPGERGRVRREWEVIWFSLNQQVVRSNPGKMNKTSDALGREFWRNWVSSALSLAELGFKFVYCEKYDKICYWEWNVKIYKYSFLLSDWFRRAFKGL